MENHLSLAFFGSSPNSVTVLTKLLESGFTIAAVVTVPPKPVGRKQILTKSPVQSFAEDHALSVLTPEPLDAEFAQRFASKPLTVGIAAYYAKLIPKDILNHPKLGFLNLHPSLLPKYRGASPAEYAILNGEKETGLTIIKMDEKFDHGPIIAQFKEEIREDDTAETLYNRLFIKGAEVLVTILPSWIEGHITPRPQNHKQATFAPRLTRDDGFVPWETVQAALNGETVPLEQISGLFKKAAEFLRKKDLLLTPYSILLERAVRAFHPWPGVWTKVKVKSGEKRLKILNAHLEGNKLVIERVQLEGKQPMEYARLHPPLV